MSNEVKKQMVVAVDKYVNANREEVSKLVNDMLTGKVDPKTMAETFQRLTTDVQQFVAAELPDDVTEDEQDRLAKELHDELITNLKENADDDSTE